MELKPFYVFMDGANVEGIDKFLIGSLALLRYHKGRCWNLFSLLCILACYRSKGSPPYVALLITPKLRERKAPAMNDKQDSYKYLGLVIFFIYIYIDFFSSLP